MDNIKKMKRLKGWEKVQIVCLIRNCVAGMYKEHL